jgi:hypothetical protein
MCIGICGTNIFRWLNVFIFSCILGVGNLTTSISIFNFLFLAVSSIRSGLGVCTSSTRLVDGPSLDLWSRVIQDASKRCCNCVNCACTC